MAIKNQNSERLEIKGRIGLRGDLILFQTQICVHNFNNNKAILSKFSTDILLDEMSQHYEKWNHPDPTSCELNTSYFEVNKRKMCLTQTGFTMSIFRNIIVLHRNQGNPSDNFVRQCFLLLLLKF